MLPWLVSLHEALNQPWWPEPSCGSACHAVTAQPPLALSITISISCVPSWGVVRFCVRYWGGVLKRVVDRTDCALFMVWSEGCWRIYTCDVHGWGRELVWVCSPVGREGLLSGLLSFLASRTPGTLRGPPQGSGYGLCMHLYLQYCALNDGGNTHPASEIRICCLGTDNNIEERAGSVAGMGFGLIV